MQLRDNPRVTDAALAAFAECWHVMHLDLSGTAAGDAGLTEFRWCQQLATLDLTDTRVTGPGLAALEGFTDMTHVRLNETATDDRGLAHLRGCTRLVYLDVRKTKVTPAGVAGFAAARPLCRVVWDAGAIEPR